MRRPAPAHRVMLATLLGLATALPARAEVLLHAFNWRYADVAARAAEIKTLGYGGVLVAPPLKSEGSAWWARYQPQDYRVIDHPLGNTEDFIRMSAALEARGLTLHADLVLNHMANEAAQRPDLGYPGTRVRGVYASNPGYWDRQRLWGDLGVDLFTGADFNPAFCITNYNSVVDVQTGRLCSGGGDAGLPDLNSGAHVIAQQRRYLEALVALGVDGFRLDAAKHMPLSHVNTLFAGGIVGSRPVVGELITGGGRGNGEHDLFLAPWMAQTTLGAYDFPLFHHMRQAFGFGGDLSILLTAEADGQALPGGRAWTFAVNHDIPLNGIFRGQIMDATDEALAWAWLITRGSGTPLLYSDNNESGDNRWRDLYRRSDIATLLRFHNAVGDAPMAMLSASACVLFYRRGDIGLVGINKCGEPRDVVLPGDALAPSGVYVEGMAGGTLAARGRTVVLSLPPRAARVWLRNRREDTCGTRAEQVKERRRCQAGIGNGEGAPAGTRRDPDRRDARRDARLD
ncbi:MAG: alpha-amylase family glycosyl hydrolase [Silanimonas sp.]|nr:alpha-amylase family glycosyl hydrolase [Silanimonas sp.]